MVKTIPELIELWPGKTQGIAADLGVGIETAKAFKKRDCIPYWYWPRLLEKAREHGLTFLTADFLVALAAARFRKSDKAAA